MKNYVIRITVGCLAIFLMTSSAWAGSVFPDVDEDADYAEAVEYLNDIGIMQGDENGNFNPDKSGSRAEMATLICRMLGETENLTTTNTFTDVPVSHWANGYVAKAASLGIIGGYGDGRFGPSDDVTYEQAIKMVVSAIGLSDSAEDNGGYPDGYISVAEGNNLLLRIPAQKGVPLTRASVAQLLFNYYNQNV